MSSSEIETYIRTVAVRLIIMAVAFFFLGYLIE